MKVLYIELDNLNLKCGICHSEVLDPSKVYQSEFLFIPICEHCDTIFTSNDKALVLNLLSIFGGYFRMFPSETYSIIEDIRKISKENLSIDNEKELEKINIKLLHNALLHGITPQEYILKLKVLI
ncbi:MAG: hypothetical protein KGD57_09585 [Candidatus Lokiarchaeota archaeon]|nr:hypothetical protein [Candidatus Lokiarchaeota archaeon]